MHNCHVSTSQRHLRTHKMRPTVFVFLLLMLAVVYPNIFDDDDDEPQDDIELTYAQAIQKAAARQISADVEAAFRRELALAEQNEPSDYLISIMVNLAAYLLDVGNNAGDETLWKKSYNECAELSMRVLALDPTNIAAQQNRKSAIGNKKLRSPQDPADPTEATCDNETCVDPIDIPTHLQKLSELDLLPSAHKSYLLGLRAAGFNPRVIYDIGSCVLHWTKVAAAIWPNATIILFDAFAPVDFLYERAGYKHYIGLLSDTDGQTKHFYQNERYPGGSSYYREIAHEGKFFPVDKFLTMNTSTLDTIVKEKKFPKPDLVKIDTQGSELDIIKGGKNIIGKTKHLIVEMQHNQYNLGAPLANASIPVIEKHGFKLVATRFSDNGDDADYAFRRISV
jgi:FkbM family methyltransferase